jgi:hypothetical protein
MSFSLEYICSSIRVWLSSTGKVYRLIIIYLAFVHLISPYTAGFIKDNGYHRSLSLYLVSLYAIEELCPSLVYIKNWTSLTNLSYAHYLTAFTTFNHAINHLRFGRLRCTFGLGPM